MSEKSDEEQQSEIEENSELDSGSEDLGMEEIDEDLKLRRVNEHDKKIYSQIQGFWEDLIKNFNLFCISNKYGYYAFGWQNALYFADSFLIQEQLRINNDLPLIDELIKIDINEELGTINNIKLSNNEQEIVLVTSKNKLIYYDPKSILLENKIEAINIIDIENDNPIVDIIPNPNFIPYPFTILLFKDSIQLMETDGTIAWEKVGEYTSVSWSPKGKQLAASFKDGKVHRYSPNGTEKGIFDKPQELEGEWIAYQNSWIKSSLILSIYVKVKEDEYDDLTYSIFIIDFKEKEEIKYINFEEPFSIVENEDMPLHFKFTTVFNFSLHHEILIIIGATLSSDFKIIKYKEKWSIAEIEEGYDIVMPLIKGVDAMPLSIDLDLNGYFKINNIVQDAEDIPPMPIIVIINSFGNVQAFDCLSKTLGLELLSSKAIEDNICTPFIEHEIKDFNNLLESDSFDELEGEEFISIEKESEQQVLEEDTDYFSDGVISFVESEKDEDEDGNFEDEIKAQGPSHNNEQDVNTFGFKIDEKLKQYLFDNGITHLNLSQINKLSHIKDEMNKLIKFIKESKLDYSNPLLVEQVQKAFDNKFKEHIINIINKSDVDLEIPDWSKELDFSLYDENRIELIRLRSRFDQIYKKYNENYKYQGIQHDNYINKNILKVKQILEESKKMYNYSFNLISYIGKLSNEISSFDQMIHELQNGFNPKFTKLNSKSNFNNDEYQIVVLNGLMYVIKSKQQINEILNKVEGKVITKDSQHQPNLKDKYVIEWIDKIKNRLKKIDNNIEVTKVRNQKLYPLFYDLEDQSINQQNYNSLKDTLNILDKTHIDQEVINNAEIYENKQKWFDSFHKRVVELNS